MFSHVYIGISDFDRAMVFYQPLMAVLNVTSRFVDTEKEWAGWESKPDPRPLFLIGKPYDKQPHQSGNGQMTAFLANSRDVVDQAYALALKNGGTCEGKPGLRPDYHTHYYGAYFRDPDGNKLCVVCHISVP